jgi:ribosomal protein S18 acetylase RimI-like enzyme
VLAIERVAFGAWPAAEVVEQGGWRLRFNHGVTHRGNSVWPGPGPGGGALGERIEAAERFYAARRLPACFQLSPAADPPGLDAALAERGYEIEAPVLVQTAPGDVVEKALRAATRAGASASCVDALDEDWFAISGRRGRFEGAATEVYRGLLGRLAGRAGFALVREQREPVAVGLCVVDPPRAGVFSMLTLPDRRGRGLGAAVLGAIARFARERGAGELYLQVEEENAAARSLYARAGFVTRYRYHYRTR